MKFERIWAMPNHNTFSIKPIKELIQRWIDSTQGIWIDPFSRNSPFITYPQMYSNDLNEEFEADYHLEALEFFAEFNDGTIDGCLFDPPYSVRQISECYKGVGRKVHMTDTQSSFYGDRKKEVARILSPGGIAICFGWNSGGIGKKLGFELVEILLVPHGTCHNDTICTVERKL